MTANYVPAALLFVEASFHCRCDLNAGGKNTVSSDSPYRPPRKSVPTRAVRSTLRIIMIAKSCPRGCYTSPNRAVTKCGRSIRDSGAAIAAVLVVFLVS